jgi:aspartyl/glutamyl-tRNA(Asn/Gln) amidotransferase C subunit
VKIEQDLIQRLSQLSQLQLSQEEEQWYSEEIGKILGYVELLERFQTDDVQEFDHEKTSFFRDDFEAKSEVITKVLSQAPSTEQSMFVVPKVLGTE